MQLVSYNHVCAVWLHGKLSQGQVAYLHVLPMLHPAGPIKFLAFRINSHEHWRETVFHVCPMLVTNGLPHGALMVLRPRSVVPSLVFWFFPGSAAQAQEVRFISCILLKSYSLGKLLPSQPRAAALHTYFIS